MKKKYTKQQIQEAISYWKKQLIDGNYCKINKDTGRPQSNASLSDMVATVGLHTLYKLNKCINCDTQTQYQALDEAFNLDEYESTSDQKDYLMPVLIFGKKQTFKKKGREFETPTSKEFNTFYQKIGKYYKNNIDRSDIGVVRAYCVVLQSESRWISKWRSVYVETYFTWKPYEKLPKSLKRYKIYEKTLPASMGRYVVDWNSSTSDVYPDSDILRKFLEYQAICCRAKLTDEESLLDLAKEISLNIDNLSYQDALHALRNSEIYRPNGNQGINPDFYAAWLIPELAKCGSEEQQVAATRSATAYTVADIWKWITDNKRADDLVIPPVKYSADEKGVYSPEDGKVTADMKFSGLASLKPYQQIPKIRTEPRSIAEQKHIQRLITDVAARVKKRMHDTVYNHSGRREELAANKSEEQIATSRENSARRQSLRDDICRKFFPDQYEKWKNGETKAIRDQARAELVDLLDFSSDKGSGEIGDALREWRAFYDRFASRRREMLEKIKAAIQSKNEYEAEKALAQYNYICKQFREESANGDELTQYLAIDVNTNNMQKYDELVGDVQALHDRKQ